MSLIENLTSLAQQAPGALLAKVMHIFFNPGAPSSLISLAVAFGIGASFLMLRQSRRRKVRFDRVIRIMLHRRIFLTPSARADLGFFLFNSFLYAALFGWAVMTQGAVREAILGLFGGAPGAVLPGWAVMAIATPVLFLAAELSYWLTHWLLHRFPFLWAFHQVHHSAEVLTPATNFRVHPVETILFANIVALVMGSTNAVLDRLLGAPAGAFLLFDRNVLAVGGLFLLTHLQHSHLWIIFPGWLGRVFYSPAHHQIHHSTDPAHFGRNLGSFLLFWDKVFGTHYQPPATRPRSLTFGVEPIGATQHSITGGLITPFVAAARTLRPRPATPEAEPAQSG